MSAPETVLDVLTQLNEDDLDDLYALSREYFDEYAGHDKTSRVAELTREHIRNYFEAFIDRQGRQATVARSGGSIVGYSTYYEKPRQCFYEIASIGEISGIFVRTKDRNKGIGEALLDRAKNYFRTRRIQYYSLFTSKNDLKGIEFFERNGMYVNNVVLHGEIGG